MISHRKPVGASSKRAPQLIRHACPASDAARGLSLGGAGSAEWRGVGGGASTRRILVGRFSSASPATCALSRRR
eukprot:scaffold48632_cov59-Phaeocystis_antarctica.AAC.3